MDFYIIYLVIIGILVGLFSGLLGVGGGFIMVPLQYFLFTSMGMDPNLALPIATATSLAVIIPTSIVSSRSHYKESYFDLKVPFQLGIFGVMGSFIGGFLAVNIPANILSKFLAILLILVSIQMFFYSDKEYFKHSKELSWFELGFIGILIGILAGLFGIGGGVVMVPVLVMFLGFSMIDSVGVSSVFIFITAAGGLISYFIMGLGLVNEAFTISYINYLNFFVIVALSIPIADFSAKLAHKIPQKRLKQLFSIFLMTMALKLLDLPILFGF